MEAVMAERATESIRANVTIPEEVADLFRWLVKYDRRFDGSNAAVAAHLVRVGAETMYAESLAQAEPLPEGIARNLAASSAQALAEHTVEPTRVGLPHRRGKAG
jgi:hypothetical protein